jgi:hypothetical protein
VDLEEREQRLGFGGALARRVEGLGEGGRGENEPYKKECSGQKRCGVYKTKTSLFGKTLGTLGKLKELGLELFVVRRGIDVRIHS